jgi:hypothetical protein
MSFASIRLFARVPDSEQQFMQTKMLGEMLERCI